MINVYEMSRFVCEVSDYSDKIKITEIKKDFFKLSVGGTGVSPVIL